MKIFRKLLDGRRYTITILSPQEQPPLRPDRYGRKRPAPQPESTPIHSVRRKFFLLGIPYSVRLNLEAERNALTIDRKNRIFRVSLFPATRENFEGFIKQWYRRRAREVFMDAVVRWLPRLAEAGYPVPMPRMKIFDMRRAWGRCYYTKGLITMNVHLLGVPQRCIDYIVLHELCHFVVHNHSKDFHALVSRLMPDWKERDEQLKAFARENRIIR